VSQLIDDAKLYDHGILLEYQLPMTSKRDAAVIIELKQWDQGSGNLDPAVATPRDFRDGARRGDRPPHAFQSRYATYDGTGGDFSSRFSSCSYSH